MATYAQNRARLLAAAPGAAAVPKPPDPLDKDGTGGKVTGKKNPNGINVDPADPLGSAQSLLNAANPLGAITAPITAAAAWIGNPRNWVRILEVIGGSVLCIIALFLMARSGAGPVADGMGTVVTAPVKVVKTVASVK